MTSFSSGSFELSTTTKSGLTRSLLFGILTPTGNFDYFYLFTVGLVNTRVTYYWFYCAPLTKLYFGTSVKVLPSQIETFLQRKYIVSQKQYNEVL